MGSDSRPMVAAALQILASLAASAEQRETVVGPWAWQLWQRARQLERGGSCVAGAQAKVIARMVSAVALGELSAEELARAAAEETRIAADVLASAMLVPRRATP
jgi:hypothetical protein